jgi:LPXTG-site transpeptidase (sortase) family protein
MVDMHDMHKKVFSFSSLLILLGVVFIILSFWPLIKDEIRFYFMELKHQKYALGAVDVAKEETVFGRLLTTRSISIQPVNKVFEIVIERIGVNAPIVADVATNNEQMYKEALKSGVAHAASSDYPSEKPGNVYLFAHASLNFWDLGKYSTVFNLLKKLSFGDRIHIFYKGRTFVYEVVNKEVVTGWNTNSITRATIEPILTLQTCDPPGTTLNRFIVTAKLKEVQN